MNKEEIKNLIRNKIIINPITDCWNYIGGLDKDGYGIIYYNGFNYKFHRLVNFAFNDFDLNSSLDTLHRCDNRKCGNPEHLFSGTNQDNIDDKMSKGRHRNGFRSRNFCPKNHPYNKSNTYYEFTKSGSIKRHCLICRRERARILSRIRYHKVVRLKKVVG